MSSLDHRTLTPEDARLALRKVGVALDVRQLDLEKRDDRWLVRLPGNRIAWFAASGAARELLAFERHILRVIADRCSFAVPRILFVSDDLSFDLRETVPGLTDHRLVFERVAEDHNLAVCVGDAIGAILAEQHTRVLETDLAPWLPRSLGWPKSRAWVTEQLPSVVMDKTLIARADSVMQMYEHTRVEHDDLVLVHGDVGFHNLAFDPHSLAVRGIFDYTDAAWADRHHDFRYLIFDRDRFDLFEAARSAYQSRTERTIDTGRVLLYNAVCALTFLAFRAGTRSDQVSCGRTLEQDLEWSRHAITTVLGP